VCICDPGQTDSVRSDPEHVAVPPCFGWRANDETNNSQTCSESSRADSLVSMIP